MSGLVRERGNPQHAAVRAFRWILLGLVPLAVAGWWFRADLGDAWLRMADYLPGRPGAPSPDPRTYQTLVAELERWRGDLAERHRRAAGEEERAAIERDARVLLEKVLPEMMRCWLGTPWDFNGTAAAPGGGKIACGYFVATVLKDAGFRVDRYQLAQQPSGNILRTFLEKPDCHLTSGEEYASFSTTTARREPGVYLTGLDTHVAFIVVDGAGAFRFIHASGSRPWCVVDEAPGEAGVLQRSKWRMLGNLTADPRVIRRWLRGEALAVHRG